MGFCHNIFGKKHLMHSYDKKANAIYNDTFPGSEL